MSLWRWQHGTESAVLSATRETVSFQDVPGWSADNHHAALAAYQKSAHLHPSPAPIVADAQTYFETHFEPRFVADSGFVTAYYQPELDAAWTPSARFAQPIYALPPELEFAPPGEALAAEGVTAGRRVQGVLQPFYTRAEIDEGALAGRGLEIAYVESAVDLFVLHVQGGGVLRFPDGSRRVTFAGKNGFPYTSIAKQLVARGELAVETATLDTLLTWLRADDRRARALMHENKSYIFFRVLPPEETAAKGSLGVDLTDGRSLAVDPRYNPLGLPVFVHAPHLTMDGKPFARLMIAQDTGSAIRGPARGDIYVGTGAKAGRIAGAVKHACKFYILLPRAGA
jgi:membrane-bound lytic murein transglycosylase A